MIPLTETGVRMSLFYKDWRNAKPAVFTRRWAMEPTWQYQIPYLTGRPSCIYQSEPNEAKP